ncbi:zinc finger protein 398-like isoform X2 [Hemicordylus capensis]|uniref:zinc finger protein 398-like isoform X2 n=1 Tax=Hemicordylus capensis TaxID=884348 RepID=UPI0023045425|nr:zinc finger protein 398-like isoform X2 [Hemicordylus capensis]
MSVTVAKGSPLRHLQQPSRWTAEVQASALPDASFPKEAPLQTATISLWTVVGAVQAVERTVEAQALRLLSLEQRSGTAEKRFADCEKAVAELGRQLESRWSALGTLLQEYGQLQRRLEDMENLLKSGNFWVRRVPVGAAGEGSKVSATFGDISSHFPREKWESLEDWQKELCKNVVKRNCESLISLDFAVSKLESLACAEARDPAHVPDSGGPAQEPAPAARTDSSPASRTEEIISWVKQEDSSCARDSGTAQEGGLCQGTCNYYTVSKLDSLPSDSKGAPPCAPHQPDLDAEAHHISTTDSTESPDSRTDGISWIKQEEQLAARDKRDSHQGDSAYCEPFGDRAPSCSHHLPQPCHLLSSSGEVRLLLPLACLVVTQNWAFSRVVLGLWNALPNKIKASDRPGLRHLEEHQPEDPANPPLLLFFPGGSVAPIFNGAIGESQPLSDLHGACLGRRAGGSKPRPPAVPPLEAGMDRPHTCLECGKTFSLLLSLQIHQMNHQKKKQYECAYCEVAFSCPSELVRHQMIHTGERPYKCTVCGKGFVRKQHLIPHLRLHTGERPYHCAECGKDFICKHHLLEHQRTHTGERPYACPACGKKFQRKKSLKDHLRVHSAERGTRDSAQPLPQEPETAGSRTGNMW